MSKFKVVFHMDRLVKVDVALTNISNLITDIGIENLEIQMVTAGDAVKAFMRNTSEFGPLLNELAEKQVEFSACATAMRTSEINKNQLMDFVNVVFLWW